MARTEVYSIQKHGGGSYNRGGRWYRSSICGPCAARLLVYLGTFAGARQSGFSGSGLLDIAEVVDPTAAAAYRARRDQDRAAEQRRREEQQRG
jgi:hypothetical protein